MTTLQTHLPEAAFDANPDSAPIVHIGRREIRRHGAVYVIAEAGVNHDGDAGAARALVDAAHAAGADAVKFQFFRADRLVAPGAPQCAYQQAHDPAKSQQAMLKRLELSLDDFADLKAHADRLGIEFLATPFGPEELSQLVALGVPAIKIASPDIVNAPLLDAARESGLPIIASTGAADQAEIDTAVARLRRGDSQHPIVLMHCVSAYPVAVADLRLGCIAALAQRYKTHVGFSDHFDGIESGAWAVAAGAAVLEKHLTLDRHRSGPDHFFSLEPVQFAEYVATARRAALAMGDGRLRASTAELEVRKLARGSIVAARTIRAGSCLSAESLMVRRPGTGLSPGAWDDVIGRTAAIDIAAGTPVTGSMLR